MTAVKYRTADVDGCNIFYREAGTAHAAKLLLLHGFPRRLRRVFGLSICHQKHYRCGTI